ncbi:hypothetical protein B0J14DRAFT_598818 [Halenospora varia]|nr:hypothetical protein B0J14DRAFT_598818 [Halenospora varia]
MTIPIILPRSLSTDNKLNIIFGIFAATTGTLSCLLAWAAWKLAYGRRYRHREHEDIPLDNLPMPPPLQSSSSVGRGYELSFRIGRTS